MRRRAFSDGWSVDGERRCRTRRNYCFSVWEVTATVAKLWEARACHQRALAFDVEWLCVWENANVCVGVSVLPGLLGPAGEAGGP